MTERLSKREFTYHLKVMIDHDLICKTTDGKFHMTEKGKKLMESGKMSAYLRNTVAPEQNKILEKLDDFPKVNARDLPVKRKRK